MDIHAVSLMPMPSCHICKIILGKHNAMLLGGSTKLGLHISHILPDSVMFAGV
jgi:hypothetical protein